MFTPADDVKLGIAVERSDYPEGEDGIQKSLAKICKKIREGMTTAVMQSYAGNVLLQAQAPIDFRSRAAIFLEHVRKNVLYAPDPLGTEKIQSAMVTLCVKGAPICIPIEDCDGLVTALGTLCAAAGMEVEVIRQFFGAEHQQHVLVEVKLEDGTWFPLDPSSKSMPAGSKARAVRETRCSPWDPQITGISEKAEFIGIGALPVFMWGHGWRLIPETSRLEDSMTGLGAIWEGAAILQPQIDWLGQAWRVVDADGRSWADANASALGRAASRNWPEGDATAKSDLLALIVSSAIQARAVQSMPEMGSEAADALTRTWLVLVRKLGFDPATVKPKDMRARMQQEGATQANLAVLDLVLLVVAGIIGAAIYAIGVYAVASILNNLVSKYFVDQELIRKHAEWQKIVDRHLNDPTLPWTEGEKQVLKDLEGAQAGLAEKQAEVPNTLKPYDPNKPRGFWDSPWAWAGLATALGMTVVAVVYREEIKQALGGGRKRLAA